MSRVRGQFTLRAAGILVLASAALEILSLRAEVPLLGAVRGGAVASAYHLAYTALFTLMGIGLWRGTRWGLQAVYAATAVYTLDKGLVVLDRSTLAGYIDAQFGRYALAPPIDPDTAAEFMALAYLVLIAGWWLFALYARWRRAWFDRARKEP